MIRYFSMVPPPSLACGGERTSEEKAKDLPASLSLFPTFMKIHYLEEAINPMIPPHAISSTSVEEKLLNIFSVEELTMPYVWVEKHKFLALVIW